MPYRTVTRVRKLAGKLAGHARRHARRVAASATARYRELLPPGREFLDLYEYQVRLGEELEANEIKIRRLDDLHAAALQLAHELRTARDQWAERLHEALLQLKRIADGYHGPGASRRLFQEDPRLPKDPVALHQMAQRAFDVLTAPDFELLPNQPGVVIDPVLLADSFREVLEGLTEALSALHSAESDVKHTQSLKDAAMAEAEALLGRVARFYEALYTIAGHELLAKRLRPSSHQRDAGEPEEVEEVEESEAVEPVEAAASGEGAVAPIPVMVPGKDDVEAHVS